MLVVVAVLFVLVFILGGTLHAQIHANELLRQYLHEAYVQQVQWLQRYQEEHMKNKERE